MQLLNRTEGGWIDGWVYIYIYIYIKAKNEIKNPVDHRRVTAPQTLPLVPTGGRRISCYPAVS